MDIGKVIAREITDEMRESYLDYAMSVIVARALPDVRDGLKPVHRRILYAMNELGLRSSARHRKSAAIIGEVLGKYHPHGDAPVYDAVARMAQDFSLRYPLVDGQGNFGSMDGDRPAAMRYTEARMSRLAEEMLRDIDKDTVDWQDNYDGTKQEPMVLPARVPQLLLNGSVGIAVGMATNIPPHNLGEVVDALIHLIENREASTEKLVGFIKGPDFPTGGEIYNSADILHTYATGRGPIVARGKAEIVAHSTKAQGDPERSRGVEGKGRSFDIVVTEIPFQVNKATLLETIADLVRLKKLEGIKDVRDESDKDGVRIVIELKTDAQPQKILNQLWKLTDLQKTFHVNMLALVDGIQPQVLPLKRVLELYLEHQKTVIERRSRYDRARAEERAHILEGLSKALKNIDAVIETIKKSATKEEAHQKLMSKFKLTGVQSTAILEMRLQTLAGLEQKKIADELKEKRELIEHLTDLIEHPAKLWGVVKTELTELRRAYADERRTTVNAQAVGELKAEDLIAREEVIITLSRNGFIKRLEPGTWQTQRRGGQGKIGAAVSEEDVVEHLIVSSSHDTILFFTSSGKVFHTKAYEIPVSSRTAKGRSIVNFLSIGANETITAIVPLPADAKKEAVGFLVMATRGGIIKKTPLKEFANIRVSGLIAIKLKKDDELSWVHPTDGANEVILISSAGQAVRFSERDVRPMGRAAGGVIGMRLKKDDKVVGMDVLPAGAAADSLELLIILANGYGKKTTLKNYRRQRRGGVGIKTAKVTAKTGVVVSARILAAEAEDLIAISDKGQVIRTKLAEIPSLGRATQGVRVMRLKEKDEVASITTL